MAITELAEPGPRSHGEAERALDSRVHRFGHRALIVAFIVDSGVVRVIVASEDAVFDQGSDAEFTQCVAE